MSNIHPLAYHHCTGSFLRFTTWRFQTSLLSNCSEIMMSIFFHCLTFEHGPDTFYHITRLKIIVLLLSRSCSCRSVLIIAPLEMIYWWENFLRTDAGRIFWRTDAYHWHRLRRFMRRNVLTQPFFGSQRSSLISDASAVILITVKFPSGLCIILDAMCQVSGKASERVPFGKQCRFESGNLFLAGANG